MVSQSHLYCAQCGAANPPHARFCVACGRSLPLDLSMPLPAIHPAPKVSSIPPDPSTLSQPSLVQNALLKQRYRILSQIGQGGFAEVYKAEDSQFGGRLVAIKSMSTDSMSPREVSEAAVAFEREALMLANLTHPNLPAIYDYFSENRHHYLVMSFIDGITLEEYLRTRGGRLPVEKVLPIGIQLCSVLNYLHKRQTPIIFRDLKPSNVMRTPERQLYLIDFGVARLFKHGQARDTIALGSPGYAAPEQYGKMQTTPQADIYSLGAVLHQFLSGVDPSELPFQFASLHIPAYPDLNTLIMCMVESDARKRPASMSTVKQELQRIALGHTSEWAQQNWQNNKLHFAASQESSPAPAAPRSPGLRPLQLQKMNPQQVPAQNSMHHTQPPIFSSPPAPATQMRVGGQQQIFYQRTPSAQPLLPSSRLSRRTILASGIGGLFVTGGLFAYFMTQHIAPAAIIAPQSAQPPLVNPIPTSAAQTLNPAVNPAALLSVAWSPDGKRIVTGGGSGRVNVLDSAGNLINTYTGHNATISGLSWSPDSLHIASASYDTTVQIWDPNTDKLIATYGQNVGAVNTVAWSPMGRSIASADYAHNVQVWDAFSMQPLQTYTNHTDQVKTLAWSRDGMYIASGSADYSVQVWNAMSASVIFNYRGHNGAVNSVAWSPDGMHIASASDDQTVRVWDALSGDHLYTYGGHNAPVTAIAWSRDGRYIASASQDTTVQIWSVPGANISYTYREHGSAVLSVAWSPSGPIVSTDVDGNLRVWRSSVGA